MWSNEKKSFEIRRDLCETLERRKDIFSFVKRNKTNDFVLLSDKRYMSDDYEADDGFYQGCCNASIYIYSLIKQVVNVGDINIGKVECNHLGGNIYETKCELYYKKADLSFMKNMLKGDEYAEKC